MNIIFEIAIFVNLILLTLIALAQYGSFKRFSNTQAKELSASSTNVAKELVTVNENFIKLAKEVSHLFAEGTNQSLASHQWAQEFHRLLLNDFAKFPKSTVYGFLLKSPNVRQERIDMIAADTFEEAQAVSQQILQKE